MQKLNKSIRVIESNDKYLSKEILLSLFEEGKTIHLDKQVCGNGLTSRFSKTSSEGKINIIISPHRGFVLDKETTYDIHKTIGTHNGIRQKFIYGESSDRRIDDCDCLFIVADSFKMYANTIKGLVEKGLIGRVLIDESDSFITDSSYRRRLIDFIEYARDILGNTTPILVSTASPLLYQKVDVKIKNNKYNQVLNTITTNDEKQAIKDIKELLKNPKNKVIVGTNNKKVIYALRGKNNVLKCCLLSGNTLKQKLSQVVKIEEQRKEVANLFILSSNSFAGVDLLPDVEDNGKEYAHAFLFENRNIEWQTFKPSNRYQFFMRSRTGLKSVNYVRIDKKEKRVRPIRSKCLKKSVTKFINSPLTSIAQKQTKEFKKYHPYVIFDNSKDTYTAKINLDAINMFEEDCIADDFRTDAYDEFNRDRNITFIDNRNEQAETLPAVRCRNKEENLKANINFIEKYDLFGSDFYFDVYQTDAKETQKTQIKSVLRRLNTYLMCKNYNGLYTLNIREEMALKILNNENNEFDFLLKKALSINEKYHNRRHGKRRDKNGLVAERRNKVFRESSIKHLLSLIQMYVNNKVYAPDNYVGSRNYNIPVMVSLDVISYVGSIFSYKVIEYDIRNCFPRVLYSIFGKVLPSDFYGSNKVNKIAINTFINNFMLNDSLETDERIQKVKSKDKFDKYGFDKEVRDFLIDKFFNSKFRGDIFNFLSYHELKITLKLKNIMQDLELNSVGRHDSRILFLKYEEFEEFQKGKQNYLNRLANDINYNGVNGWFNMPIYSTLNEGDFEAKMLPNEKKKRFLDEMVTSTPYKH